MIDDDTYAAIFFLMRGYVDTSFANKMLILVYPAEVSSSTIDACNLCMHPTISGRPSTQCERSSRECLTRSCKGVRIT